jgi:CBS domain-containing protein
MKDVKAKDLMVPIEDYATVSEEASLYDAVLALEEAQRRFDQNRDRHRAILVYDKNNRIVGKLSQLDVIRGLEPKYDQIGDLKAIAGHGFTPEFIQSLVKSYSLWEQPLQDICSKAAHIKVKHIMYTPTQGEYVPEDASLDQVVHQLIMGRHQSLLVSRGRDIVGILRLSDVFREICNRIKECRIDEGRSLE